MIDKSINVSKLYSLKISKYDKEDKFLSVFNNLRSLQFSTKSI